MSGGKMLMWGVIAVAIVALGVGVWWYVSVPHTPEAQFAYAETLEKALRGDALTQSPAALAPRIEQVIEQYRRVGTRFGKSPKAAEALKRIAGIQETVAKDAAKALATLEGLIAEYSDEDNAGFALMEEARLIRKAADDLKGDKKPEAEGKYKEALAKLEDYRKRFEKGKQADGALMEIGRIWQDGLEEPLIRPIETFDKFLADYPDTSNPNRPEALFRLAKAYDKAKENERALNLYARLLEEFPKCKYAEEAIFNRGKILAERMEKHDDAAKEFEKVREQFPEGNFGGSAGASAREEQGKAASAEGEQYGRSRYGGTIPWDTVRDKPLPPAEMIKEFAEQKLDALDYDLNVEFTPSENRITVNGTLRVANRGDEKKDLLLMLGKGLKVSSATVDGAATTYVHTGEALRLALPTVMKKDAEVTASFTYSGQYADAEMLRALLPGPAGPRGGAGGATGGDPSTLKGKAAPNIALKSLDGKDLSLAEQRGKVVLVDLWATWCGPCRASMPHLQKTSADASLAAKGLQVWAVNEQESRAVVEKFISDNKYTFTVLLDETGGTLKSYLTSGIPTTIVVGRDGTVKETFVGYGGAMDKDIDAAIEKALAEPAPSGPAPIAVAPATAPATTKAATRSAPGLAVDPQMALGDFGYALSGASWYPITFIGDVFNAHVTMKVPADMEAVANGALVRREKSTRAGTPGIFEFKTHSPVFGLYFAYGPYVMQERQSGGIQYYTYLRPGNAGKHDAYVQVADGILSFYSGKFGGFPYEKMALVETPLPPFLGGVGPASLMFLQETMVAHPEVPENLLAHELAHQWFGNYIPINIADPHYSQWMSEGFATYCDALYTEHRDGPKALSLHVQKYGQLFFQLWLSAPPGSGSIRDTPSMTSPMYRPVVYEKGAIVLHMLRKVMGDEKFFALMRKFVETYHDQPTTVDDFRRMASSVNGADLSWFFAQWIDQSVFAHWKVDAQVTGGEKAGETAAVKITITQPDDLVKMPADITLIGAKGERKVLANQMLDQKEQTIEATAPFRPVKVVVDEDYWVLRHPGSDNIWPSEKSAAATMAAH